MAKKSRLSMKYVASLVEQYNEKKGLKYKDKGYLHLSGSICGYELHEIHEQGSTGVRCLKSGTLKECYNYFIRTYGGV